ncbi:MAG: leucine-rich repeat protein, partial [Clostridia bacterium]|nr:leucine-rich repeat protein [Clostridia bacterium]
MRKRKGFTLVELVVVIAVIAILAAVLILTFSSVTEKAQHSALISNGKNSYKNLLNELGEHIDCFYQEDGYYIVFGEGGKVNELGKHNGTRFKKDAQGIYVLVDENTIRCNDVEIRSIQSILYELTAHVKAEEWSKNSTHHWHACKNKNCDEKYDEAEHSFDQELAQEAYLVSEATCTQKATYYKSCECGEKGIETFEHGDYAEHTKAAEWNKNDTHHWYECTADDCDAKVDEAEHNFEDAINFDGIVCNVCGYEKSTTEGLEYELNADCQSYYVKGIGTATSTEIIIPSVYNGMPVTSMGNNALRNCSGLTSVYIPNSITCIGDSAFYGCSSLTSIEIPNNVTSIEEGAYSGCSSLTSIEIPNSVTSIGNYAYSGCSSLTSIEIPNSVTSIGYDAFYYCRSLRSIKIPNSVTSIEDSAFRECINLKSIEISDSVTSIGNSAFYNCSSLTSI